MPAIPHTDPFYQGLAARLFALPPVGLALDIDGTLSAIASSPQAAAIDPTCREHLMHLVAGGRFGVIAAVTGRAARDARLMVGVPGMTYIGNHGLEILPPHKSDAEPLKVARPYVPLVAAVLDVVHYKLQATDGLIFENKGITAAIHYRCSRDHVGARQAILHYLEPLAADVGLYVREGRKVIEIRPPVEMHKGTALLGLVESYNLNTLLYAGDDLTDVDGFRALHTLETERSATHVPFRGIAVGVRSPEMPEDVARTADILVAGVAGVATLLNVLDQ